MTALSDNEHNHLHADWDHRPNERSGSYSSSGVSTDSNGESMLQLRERPTRPAFPHGLLNIPPPAHPPELSPSLERPLPPQRTPPPCPAASYRDCSEEPQYEEAPLPDRKSGPHYADPTYRGMLVANRMLDGHRSIDHRSIDRHPGMHDSVVYAREGHGPEVDWSNFQTRVLERTESGSFFIPSENTTMSSTISPGRKSEKEDRHYSLLPSAQTTIPVPVLHDGALPMNGKASHRHKPARCAPDLGRVSWRGLTYALAAVLVLALAVISYLVVLLLSDAPPPSTCVTHQVLSGGSAVINGYSGRPLPESFALGDPVAADLPPGFSRSSFVLQRPSHVQFNLSVEPTARLAVYGRQQLDAGPTEHDWTHVVKGWNLHASGRRRRGAKLRSTSFVENLGAGEWHVTFLNDGTDVREIRFSAAPIDAKEDCPSNCYGKGKCVNGKCVCSKGYSGQYCEESLCPEVCGAHGVFSRGKCECVRGWKGPLCDVPPHSCEVLNCNGHGKCNGQGQCECFSGFSGQFCDEKSCPSNCNSHGICHKGMCFCAAGYYGSDCGQEESCGGAVEECSGRGAMDHLDGRCACDQGYIGVDCGIALCSLPCGHGTCQNDVCVCDQGWTGPRCQHKACLPGCEEHGVCKNGTCQCHVGWNGENCQLVGCPGNCSGHGACNLSSGIGWSCTCDAQHSGDACRIPLEVQCSDDLDNDGDGLVDCQDPECCSKSSCDRSSVCQVSRDPSVVLLGKQAAPPGASFGDRVHFLVESESVQQYVIGSSFSDWSVSVIRGRVVNSYGSPLRSVRVSDVRSQSIAGAGLGFTLTRDSGEFDLMVNGGGSAALKFQRPHPLKVAYLTVRVPWNSIVLAGDVVMYTDFDAPTPATDTFAPLPSLDQSCSGLHEPSRRPSVSPSWHTAQRGGQRGLNGVLIDSQAVYLSVPIFGTDIYLTYSSALANGYHSSLWISLLGPDPPFSLRKVTLKVEVEGTSFVQEYSAMPNLTHAFHWDKRNIYGQTVYGQTTAKVSVGYTYAGCEDTFWAVEMVPMAGALMDFSNIGHWNLDIHHHLDMNGGVFQKGDGSLRYLIHGTPVVTTVLGTSGAQRPISCDGQCNGPKSQARLFKPLALATGKNDSIYVGDDTLIRKVHGGDIWNVLKLSAADTAHPYHLAVDPLSGDLYISLPLRRQIWRVANKDTVSPSVNPDSNYEPVVGTGEPCVKGEECGMGGSARLMKLSYPKGIAFNAEGTLFVADGRRVLAVEKPGESRSRAIVMVEESTRTRAECTSQMDGDGVHLEWPTHVAVSPLDESLLILDDDVIYRMTHTNAIHVAAGAPAHCGALTAANATIGVKRLRNVVALSVDGKGDVIFIESDGRKINRVKTLRPNGAIDLLAGQDSKCDCDRKNCPCDDPDNTLALHTRFHNPIAIAAAHSRDAAIYVADAGNLKVRLIRASLPEFNSKMEYELYDHDTQEMYGFNRHGHHIWTVDLLTGSALYNFSYDVDTRFGKLSRVSGPDGKSLIISRQQPSNTITLDTALARVTTLSTNHYGYIQEISGPDGSLSKLTYHQRSGLLLSQWNSTGSAMRLSYDDAGHVSQLLTPTGAYRLGVGISDREITYTAMDNDEHEERLVLRGNNFRVERNGRVFDVFTTTSHDGRGFQLHDRLTDQTIVFDSLEHSLMSKPHSSILSRKTSLPVSLEPARSALSTKVQWGLRTDGHSTAKVLRVPRVNGKDVVKISYLRPVRREQVELLDGEPQVLMDIEYNAAGQITAYSPTDRVLYAPLTQDYDSIGRCTRRTWGDRSVESHHDGTGRLIRETWRDGAGMYKREYRYERQKVVWPTEVEIPTNGLYTVDYDSYGSLQSITSPTKAVHSFSKSIDIDFIAYRYFAPGSKVPFLKIANGKGHFLSIREPTGLRRVTHVYDTHDRLSGSYYGYRSFDAYIYVNRSNLVRQHSVRQWGGSFECTSTFAYQGETVVERTEVRTIDGAPEQSITAGYHYNANLRLSVIQVTFNGKVIQPLDISYDPQSGRIDSFGGQMQFSRSKGKWTVVSKRLIIETLANAHGEPFKETYTIQGRQVFAQRVVRNKLGQITDFDVERRGKAVRGELVYNERGFLKSMSRGDRSYNLEYDLDGYVIKSNDDVITYSDQTRRPTKCGDLDVQADASGFISRKGAHNFQFDGFGRLVLATTPGAYTSRYFYDENSRLIAYSVSEKGKTALIRHFYYLNPTRSFLPSHMVEPSSGQITVLYYTEYDHLFAMESIDGTVTYVASDMEGTPVELFSSDGASLKYRLFDPLGSIEEDSAPNVFMPFGFRGHFQDPANGIVVTPRPYDPECVMYLSINPNQLFDAVDPFRPEDVVLMWGKRPGGFDLPKFPQGLQDFLSLQGVDSASILADSSQAESLTSSLCRTGPIFTGSICALSRQLTGLSLQNTLQPSRLLSPPRDGPPATFATVYGPLGTDLLTANVSGRIVVSPLSVEFNRQLLALLNNTFLVPSLSFDHSLRATHYVHKKSIISTADALSIDRTAGSVNVAPGVNVTAASDDLLRVETRYSSILVSAELVDPANVRSRSREEAQKLAATRQRTLTALGLQVPKETLNLVVDVPELTDDPNFIDL